MRIVLDNIIFSLQPAGGISLYWYELLRRMIRDGLDVTALEDVRGPANLFRARLSLPPGRVLTRRFPPVQVARYLPCRAPRAGGAVFHSSYYRWPLAKGWRTVQTVHDFTYEHARRGAARWIHAFQKRLALMGAHRVICVSSHTRQDLERFLPTLPRERVRVILLGCGQAFRPIPESKLPPGVSRNRFPKGYLLYVGSRVSYKNFEEAVAAVGLSGDYGLVVAGGGPLRPDHRALLNRRLRGRFVHLERLDDEALNGLYNHAHALIYPSTREGFGLPVVEAMAAGCPVIAVRASAIPEIAGKAALLVDWPSREALAVCIRNLENPSRRRRLRAEGFANARRFSWERCYRQTVAVYAELAAGGGTRSRGCFQNDVLR